MSKIAFLGTGTMGMPIARNLAEAGLTVSVWNRSPDRAQPLADHGASVCQELEDAAAGADLLITMLSDAATVVDCAAAAANYLKPGAIWIQMSTIGMEGIGLCLDLAARTGLQLLDAPVLGSKEPAERAELVVFAGGPDPRIDDCLPVFDAISERVIRFPEVGDGTRAKLVANNWILGITAVLAESINLAQSFAIDPRLFLEALSGGPTDSPYAHIKGEEMIDGDFSDPSFKLALAAKDAGLVLAGAEQKDLHLPVLRAVAERLDRACRDGHGNEDMAAVQLTASGALL